MSAREPAFSISYAKGILLTTGTAVRSDLPSSSPAVTRVVSYLRVSTGRQAESDLSIPDQRRHIERYCAARGWTIVEDYVEPGSSATDDRRPAFQEMIDAALAKPPTFSTILVHSYSRFFRDQFQFERYARKLAKNGVQVISITQDLGDNPMGTMMRQIMTLFDEYQSKENAKHTLRAMYENARQGYWNGAGHPLATARWRLRSEARRSRRRWRSIRFTRERSVWSSGLRLRVLMEAARWASRPSHASLMSATSARAMGGVGVSHKSILS